MLEADQRRLLGEFVRAHRERVRPRAPTGRRRTSGLRREELAALAGHQRDLVHVDRARAAPCRPPPRRSAASRKRSPCRALNTTICSSSPGRLDPEGSRGPSADAPPSLIAAVNAIELPGLWTRPPLERVLLERSGGAALSRLAGRELSTQPPALCVSRALRAGAHSRLEGQGATAARRISRRLRAHLSRRSGQNLRRDAARRERLLCGSVG